jgi:ribosomal protein L7/L12
MVEEQPSEHEEKNLDERVCELLDSDRKLEAINLVRVEKNMRWKDAEDYVESFEQGVTFLPTEEELTSEELEDKVFELLLQNKKTEAIELVRENKLTGLEESVEFVEEVERKHGLV